MRRFAHFLPCHSRATWLLLLGFLAVALHALAGTGLMGRVGSNSTVATGAGFAAAGFAADVCTSHGLIKFDAAPLAGGGSQPAGGAHDCCKLCAGGGPLLFAAVPAAVSPAPTFAAWNDARDSAPPLLTPATAHPPRGPPARA